jgi:hypothetical protein
MTGEEIVRDRGYAGKYNSLFYEYPQEYHKYGDIYANPRVNSAQDADADPISYGGFSVA